MSAIARSHSVTVSHVVEGDAPVGDPILHSVTPDKRLVMDRT